MKNYIDLHMHSQYSDDGEFSPSELVEMCHKKGIRIMAIADHNLVKGVREGREKAKELGVQYIPAVEIDCTYQDVNLHMLGYGIPEDEAFFQQLNDRVYEQEVKLSKEKIELVKKLGFQISKEELDVLSENGVYTGEMFGELLLAKEEYREHPILKPYRAGEKRGDNPYVNFYWDYFSQGKPCYTEVVYPAYAEIVKKIHQYGGKAVLAHPGANLKGKFEYFDRMMCEEPMDGVEAFSNYHEKETAEYFHQKGREYGILITCGSDFHGKTKPSIQLGESHCPYDQEFLEEALEDMGLL